jgi:hypothetical protein
MKNNCWSHFDIHRLVNKSIAKNCSPCDSIVPFLEIYYFNHKYIKYILDNIICIKKESRNCLGFLT